MKVNFYFLPIKLSAGWLHPPKPAPLRSTDKSQIEAGADVLWQSLLWQLPTLEADFQTGFGFSEN